MHFFPCAKSQYVETHPTFHTLCRIASAYGKYIPGRKTQLNCSYMLNMLLHCRLICLNTSRLVAEKSDIGYTLVISMLLICFQYDGCTVSGLTTNVFQCMPNLLDESPAYGKHMNNVLIACV